MKTGCCYQTRQCFQKLNASVRLLNKCLAFRFGSFVEVFLFRGVDDGGLRSRVSVNCTSYWFGDNKTSPFNRNLNETHVVGTVHINTCMQEKISVFYVNGKKYSFKKQVEQVLFLDWIYWSVKQYSGHNVYGTLTQSSCAIPCIDPSVFQKDHQACRWTKLAFRIRSANRWF